MVKEKRKTQQRASDTVHRSEAKPSVELELQARLVEYDTLMREHDLNNKLRTDLGVYTLAGLLALFGAVASQANSLFGTFFVHVFLILPFAFTLVTWWFIRTYYTNLGIELYLLTVLVPRLNELTGNEVTGWIGFLWKLDRERGGRFVSFVQTMSRLGLIQGGTFASLFVYGLATDWKLNTWQVIDWILILLNLVGIAISAVLTIITFRLSTNIIRAISK